MATRKYPRVELRNVKYAAFQSEETHCFEATVYVDGQKVGTARNDGHGGATFFQPYDLQKQLDAYGATFPLITDYGTPFPVSADVIVSDLVDDFLTQRDLKRLLAKTVAYTVAGRDNVYTIKGNNASELAKGEARVRHLMRNFKEQPVHVLNFMPFADALELYRKGVQ